MQQLNRFEREISVMCIKNYKEKTLVPLIRENAMKIFQTYPFK